MLGGEHWIRFLSPDDILKKLLCLHPWLFLISIPCLQLWWQFQGSLHAAGELFIRLLHGALQVLDLILQL